MKLYVSPRAPSPRRVMMFMVEKGISGIDLVNVDLNAQEHKGEAYRAKNPLAKVPALELDDGSVLTEITAICEYLDDTATSGPTLIGRTPQERAESAAKALVAAGKTKGISHVVFDRGEYIYHGRVKALAEAVAEDQPARAQSVEPHLAAHLRPDTHEYARKCRLA